MWVVEGSGMVPWSNMVSDFRETPDFRDRRFYQLAQKHAYQCSCWIGGSWIGAGFILVCFGLDLKLLWIGSEVSGAPGAPKHMTHPVVTRRFETERVGT
jgi:hypothetical protein